MVDVVVPYVGPAAIQRDPRANEVDDGVPVR